MSFSLIRSALRSHSSKFCSRTPSAHGTKTVHRSWPQCLHQGATGSSKMRLALRTSGVLALGSGLVSIEESFSSKHLTAPQSYAENDSRNISFTLQGMPLHSLAVLDSDQGISGSASEALQRMKSFTQRVVHGIEKRSQTAEGRAILYLGAMNFAVYALWKVAPTTFMVRHFASSLEAMRRGRVWTVVTSNFSHMGIFHLAANMFLLDMFGRDVVTILSPERFYVLYLAGGIASVLVSLASRRLMRNNVLSLGASGSVMATMFMYANLFPDREVYILGIWKLKARDAIVGWALIDAAGLLGSFGKIDFAAHLGGGAFSFAYYNFIREDLSREFLARKQLAWRRVWGLGNEKD